MCVSLSGVRCNGTSLQRNGQFIPIRQQSYEVTKQKQSPIAKTFRLIKIHSNDTTILHADSRQKLVYYLAKTETFSTKLHCFIHRRPIRPHFLLIPTLFCPSTRAYAHSANFRFLPSPFTTRDSSLILGELGVKAMPSNAFTRLKSFLLTRRERKNTVNEGLIFRFWLSSPLSSPSTPCISIQCRVPTLYFEVKEIKRTFTLFAHLSHCLSIDKQAQGEEVKAKNRKTPDARVRARKKGENEGGIV